MIPEAAALRRRAAESQADGGAALPEGGYIYIYIYSYFLIADSSDKGSDSRQNKNNIESKVTLQILSAVDSKGKHIGARKLLHHNVTTIVRNGRFVRPDHRSAVRTR